MSNEELAEFWGAKDARTVSRKLFLMLCAGLVFAVIGPYDTSNIPAIAYRFAYWIGLLTLTSFISGPLARLVFPRLSSHGTHAAGSLLLFSFFLSLPAFLLVLVGDMIVTLPADTELAEHVLPFMEHQLPNIVVFLGWFGQVLLITVISVSAISLINHATRPKGQAVAAEADPPGPPAGYLFLRRLPPQLGQDLICLQMEDHYLRAFTDKGDALVRVRFRDAVAELDGYPGLQVHRSWWVALGAIESVKRDGRRHVAHLRGGQKAPVSKTYVDDVKEAGFL